MKTSRQFVRLIVIAMTLGASQLAFATPERSISFDNLPSGATVTAQYAAQGVTFSLAVPPNASELPMPPPLGPTVSSLGSYSRDGIRGYAIVAGGAVTGPFYDLAIQFAKPVHSFRIIALNARTGPPRIAAYRGGKQVPKNAGVWSYGNVEAPPYVSGTAYGIGFSTDPYEPELYFDRVVIGGAEQFDALKFEFASRYVVDGGGYISFEYPGYIASGSFSFRETVNWWDLQSRLLLEISDVQFTVNGITSSGTGSVNIDNNGYINSAYLIGPFEWSFGDESSYLSTPDLTCYFGSGGSREPECLKVSETISFDAGSGVTEIGDFGLKLGNSVVAGCKSQTGTLTFESPAPVGGRLVNLVSTLGAARVPATITVPEGATTKAFKIETSAVDQLQTGFVYATSGDLVSNSQLLSVRPMGLATLSLTPITSAGGKPVNGIAKLECKAGPGPVTVDLSSSDPAVARPVASSIVIPQGVQSSSFSVITNPVQTRSKATITGSANGVSKSKKLTLTVAASISPTSLKFGNQAVNTTSVVRRTTLTNKGVVPYQIHSITLGGPSPQYYAQSNDCPTSLSPGSSCSIDVVFRPTVVAYRSAQVLISTSATAVPLKVLLTGTGVVAP